MDHPATPVPGNSHERPLPRRETATGQIHVIQVGPALNVRGGISAVERLIAGELANRFAMQHVPTMEDGPLLRKLLVFGRAISALRERCTGTDTLLVHIHFASYGSTLRKLVMARIASGAGHVVILHAHGGGFSDFLARMPRVMQRWIRHALQAADQLLVLSSQWQRFYIDECGVAPEKVTILRNPVRIPASIPARAGRETVRLLYLGRMSESKGTFDVLRALQGLPSELLSRLRLTLAGDGAVAAIKAAASQFNDAVTVHDWVDEATRNALLAEADMFVLPSYQEGIPMSVLEAMAWGLPVITTPVGGIPDVVSHDQEGLLVQPGDIAGLGAAIAALLTDEPRRLAMGARGRTRAKAFDLRDYGSRLADIYDQALAVHRAAQTP